MPSNIPGALAANKRLQEVRAAAQAKAVAEAEAIKGIGPESDDLKAARAAAATASAESAAAEKAFREISDRDRDSLAWVRRVGVPVSDWDAAYLHREATSRAAASAGARLQNIEREWRESQLARPREDVAADAEAAIYEHLAQLPDALSSALNHTEAIRALAGLAGINMIPLGGVGFDSALITAVTQTEEQIARGVAFRARQQAAAASPEAQRRQMAAQIRINTYGA